MRRCFDDHRRESHDFFSCVEAPITITISKKNILYNKITLLENSLPLSIVKKKTRSKITLVNKLWEG